MEFVKITAAPVALTLIGLLIVRVRKLSWVYDVGFRVPALAPLLAWTAAFAGWMILQQMIPLGAASAQGEWVGKYDTAQLATRLLAIGLVYPVVEEFFYRGVFLGVFRRAFGVVAGVLVPAIAFGISHPQYDWPIWIILDGIFFGMCRVRTRSVFAPMLLHVIGNAFAIWERLR